MLPCIAGHTQNNMYMDTVNALLCDPVTGACELPGAQDTTSAAVAGGQKPVTIVYFTDPICSSCWGIEPQLRKLKLEYGALADVRYHMGGLLADWSYNSGGISKPSDVAHHWDEVSRYYEMPIDGDVWLEDPLPSSYPPSVAFKAAQLQDEAAAVRFLRLIREMVFLEKKNITRWEHLVRAAAMAGLDTQRFRQDYEGPATGLFREDLALARKMGVRGFPSIFISGPEGLPELVYGVNAYPAYEAVIARKYPRANKQPYERSWNSLFSVYPTLTTKEFALLCDVSLQEAGAQLAQLERQRRLVRKQTKNGPIWRLAGER